MAWAAPVEMDGVRIWFAHRKFGVTATVYGTDDEIGAAATAADCMRRFGKAIPVVRRDLIEPLLAETIGRGDFTVPNKFPYFLEMHKHLRSLSQATGERARVAEPVMTRSPKGGIIETFVAPLLAREAEFEAVGALFAFFSLLEHLLVLGLAFTDYDPRSSAFGGFLRMNWDEKFKQVVGVGRAEDKTVYDVLRRLADENRNPAAHGGVDRNVSNVAAHLPGYGAVPTSVTSVAAGSTYTFEPELPPSVFPFALDQLSGRASDGWAAVDHVHAWMESGPLSDAYTYGASGLPLRFDAENRRHLKEAVEAGRLNEFMDRQAYEADRGANMGW